VAHYHHTEGVCLRRVDYSNTSQVAAFLTARAGRISVLAKGVTRAPRGGVRTALDILSRYEIVYTTRRSGSLHNLTYRWLRERPYRPGAGLEGLLCSYYAAELVLHFVPEEMPCPDLYDAFVRALRGFRSGERLGTGVLLLELAVLKEHGSCPAFGSCVECGGPLPPRGAVAFSSAAGGPLCPRCLAALAAVEPDSVGPTPALPARNTLAMSALLRFHMRDLLGREMRLWKYLEGRHLSRSLRRLRRRSGRPSG
jgi:DNA repair protein RecO (recombination protein O)